MKYKFYFLFYFFCALLQAEEASESIQLEVIEEDLGVLEHDIQKLTEDVLAYIRNRIPSFGTMHVDAIVDAPLRQLPWIADQLKHLEKHNPTNAAIIRDIARLLTLAYKIPQDVPVDLSGRFYDRSDLYAQISKILLKIAGFGGINLFGFDSELALFLINTGGDVFSQTWIEAGKDWRQNNQTLSFEVFVLQNAQSSFKNGAFSIPIKSSIAYLLGNFMQRLHVTEIVEFVVLLTAGRAIINKNKITLHKAKMPIYLSISMAYLQSILKSLILTTGCKTAIDATRYPREKYIEPLLASCFSNPKIQTVTLITGILTGMLIYLNKLTLQLHAVI